MMHQLAALDIHISLAAETLFTIAGFPITNALVLGAIGVAIFFGIFGYVASMLKRGKYNRFVGLVQWAFEGMLGAIDNVIPDKVIARRIAPLALTIFFFVLISYWLSILPGVASITWHGTPIFRSLAADMNFTFALAIITIVMVQVYAISRHGFLGNVKRYIKNPLKDPIGAFEGFLELIGEVSRGSALSLRLFGNALAGEVLLLIMAALTSYFATVSLPAVMIFELFIGFIQAYVFYVLTLIFTALAIDVHGGHKAEPELTSLDHSTSDTAKPAVVATE